MRTLFAVLIVMLSVGGGGALCVYSADDAGPAVASATANRNAPEKKIVATGTIEPGEMADVCAQVAGRIASLGADDHAQGKLIDYGSRVEAGTVFAQIDPEPYAARVELERATCARAEAELALAKFKLGRAEAQWQLAQGRKKTGTISQPDLELAAYDQKDAKASAAVAEAVLAEKKVALKQAEIELSYTTIKSPIKGVVIDRRVNVGQAVVSTTASFSLFLIGKLDKLQVWASVKEADIARVHKGQAVHFTVDAHPGKVFEGKVEQKRLNATMSQNVVTYTVVVAITSPTDKLLPYLTAAVTFE